MEEAFMKQKIQELILDSAYMAKDYSFENEVPNRPNGLALSKWIKKEIKEIDAEIDALEEKHGLISVCTKGCAECCMQCIVVLASECIAIQMYIDNLPVEQRNALKAKVIETCSLLEKDGFNKDSVANCFMGETAQRAIQEKYFKLNRNCVFLDDENCCMIHDIRPSLCWSYREYEDKGICRNSCFSDTSIKYDDWERRYSLRLIEARPTKKKLMILPFAVREIINW